MATTNTQEVLTPRDQKLLDQINHIHSSLESIQQLDAVRMPERVFVNIWLPFFAGDENPTYPVTITHWINFTGSPYREVKVVDTNGVVLFTVPALYDRLAIKPISGAGAASIAHVVKSASQYANVHPVQGQRYLDAELTKRAFIMKVPVGVVANLEIWNTIFTRYGRPPIIELAKSTPILAQKSSGDSDLSYDIDPL